MINVLYNFYLLILLKFIPKMKKIVVGIIIVAILAFSVDKLFFTKKAPASEATPQMALVASKNSEAFNESFEKLLNGYFSLKEAVADYDTVKANAAAKQMIVFADSLKTSE